MTVRRDACVLASGARVIALAMALAASLTLATPLAGSLAAQDSTRLRVSIVGQAAEVRTARIGTVAPERNVSLRGLDAEYWLRARGRGLTGDASRAGLGFAARAHQSTLGGDDLTFYDASVLYGLGGLVQRLAGARVRDALGDLTAEVAMGGQAGYELATGQLHGEMHSFTRIGLRAGTRIALSPLSLEARVGRLLAAGGPDGEDAMSGLDGETGVRWSFAQWPIDAALGYRFQRFKVYRTSQEVSAVRLEVGWRGFP